MNDPERLNGKVLAGVYRIEAMLATGSSSVIYRGVHDRLGHVLAIKVLAGNPDDGSLKSRFEAEARVQAKLNHPHIVAVQDFVADDGVYAIIMELVDGVGLDQIMYDLGGPMPIARIKRLMAPVCEGIAFAHDRGIVHRDIKPSNILIATVDGREYPKVMDFGIAKVLATSASQTAPGAVLGTLLFMSPEQCKALKTVDARSDVYSLGVTLYQMATGMVPFYSESAFEIMLAHVQSEPTDPGDLNPHISAQLKEILLKAMAKDPDERFQTVRDLAAALDAVPVDAAVDRAIESMPRVEVTLAEPEADEPVVADVAGEKTLEQVEEVMKAPRRRFTDPGSYSIQGPQHARIESLAKQRRGAMQRSKPALPQPTAQKAPIKPQSSLREAAEGVRLRLRVTTKEDWQRFFDPNIGGGGVFCPTPDPPDVGASVRLEITFVGGPRFFVRGVVTWRRPKLNDPRARAGVGLQVHPNERSKIGYVNTWVRGDIDDKRGLRRLPLKLRVAYQGRSGKRMNFTRDLHEEGIFVRSSELLDTGTSVRLLLFPPHEKTPYRLEGNVTRLVERANERGMGISLMFGSDEERQHYAKFVAKLEEHFLTGELPEAVLS